VFAALTPSHLFPGGPRALRSVSFDGALYLIERDRGSPSSVMALPPVPIIEPVRKTGLARIP